MELRTTAKVIDELGGYKAVAKLTGAKVDATYNWRAQNYFPKHTFLALTHALEHHGHSAPLILWRLKKPKLPKLVDAAE